MFRVYVNKRVWDKTTKSFKSTGIVERIATVGELKSFLYGIREVKFDDSQSFINAIAFETEGIGALQQLNGESIQVLEVPEWEIEASVRSSELLKKFKKAAYA